MKKEVIFIKTICILLMILSMSNICVMARDKKEIDVLLVGSYSASNDWEISIMKGFEDNIDGNVVVKKEYMDTKTSSTDEYIDNFMNLLNLKYANKRFDYVLTIDDEAFYGVRKELFKKDSFLYHTPLIFIGVNSEVSLSQEESLYITGMIETQDNLQLLNTILELNEKTQDIYLLLDDNIYSEVVRRNITNLSEITERTFNLHIISDNILENIEEDIKNIDGKNSAILICGSYNTIDKSALKDKQVVERIKELTDAPIYTKLDSYVIAGAVGGIINDGQRVGSTAAKYLIRKMAEGYTESIVLTYTNVNVPMFNFHAMREYKVNPLKLPENSIIINKSVFNLLVPRYLEIIIWCTIIGSFIGILLVIYLYIINRKRAIVNKRLLGESIERDIIKTDFFITISHELRTPLNIIINSINLLNMQLENNDVNKETAKRNIVYIKRNSQRLLKQVNNFIDISKLELNYMSINFENHNIVEVIEDTIEPLAVLAKSKGIDIIFDPEEEEIYMSIDKVKIERIIVNLISNSIKYIGNGNSIFVNLTKKEGSLLIVVKDNGIGISESLQKNIFRKFNKVNSNLELTREYEGSGLGLFIVNGFVNLHNGNMNIESEMGIGTVVTIELPINVMEDDNNDKYVSEENLNNIIEMEFSDMEL